MPRTAAPNGSTPANRAPAARAAASHVGPAVVAAHRRPVRQPDHRPGRSRRHRARTHPSRLASRTCRGQASTTPRRRSASCSATPRPASSATDSPDSRSARSARRRSPARTRWSSSSGTAPASSPRPWRHGGHQHRDPGGGGWRDRRRRELRDAQVHIHRRGMRTALPGAHLHRHRDPARRGAPRAALRRDAPGGRDPTAGLGDRRRRSVRWPPSGAWPSASACSSCSARPWRRADFTGEPFFPGDLSLRAGGHPARRYRRPGRRGGGGPCRAAAGADLPARRHPARHAARTPGLAADPAAGGHRRARLLRRRRASRDHRRPGSGVLPGISPAHGGTDHRGPVADDGGLEGHGRAHQPARPCSSPGGGCRTTRGPPSARSAGSSSPSSSPASAVGVITTLVADHGGGGRRQHRSRGHPRRPGLLLRGPGQGGHDDRSHPGTRTGKASLDPRRPGRDGYPRRPPSPPTTRTPTTRQAWSRAPSWPRTRLSAGARPGQTWRSHSGLHRLRQGRAVPARSGLARRRYLSRSPAGLPVQLIVVGTNGSRPRSSKRERSSMSPLPTWASPRPLTSKLRRPGPRSPRGSARRSGDHRQPAHRRVQPRGQRRRRPDRPQAPVQPAAAHRCPARRAAPRGRPGIRGAARRHRPDIGGDRPAGRRTVPQIPVRRVASIARMPSTTSSSSPGSSRPSGSSRRHSRCSSGSPAPRSPGTNEHADAANDFSSVLLVTSVITLVWGW